MTPVEIAANADVAGANFAIDACAFGQYDVCQCFQQAALNHTVDANTAIAAQGAAVSGPGADDDLDCVRLRSFIASKHLYSPLLPAANCPNNRSQRRPNRWAVSPPGPTAGSIKAPSSTVCQAH